MTMGASLTIKRILALVVTISILAACGADMDELDAYIVEVKARKGSGIDDLPDPNLYDAFLYVADTDGIRSPFRPDTPQISGGNDRIRRPHSSIRGAKRNDYRDRSRKWVHRYHRVQTEARRGRFGDTRRRLLLASRIRPSAFRRHSPDQTHGGRRLQTR